MHSPSLRASMRGLTAFGILGLASTCLVATAADAPKPGARLDRQGDEIVVCGQLYHTTTPVVLWTDPGGYDAYRVAPHFSAPDKAKSTLPPTRFGVRKNGLSEAELARVQAGGWDLPLLQRVVDQFVIHYDVCGTSQRCFRVLHDERGLSVHFMLDVDGTIYQTLDLKEAAWHATIANGRSIGIEIANMGAYSPGRTASLDKWYEKDADGRVKIKLPGSPEENGLHNPGALLAPARDELIKGKIRGEELAQYDLTKAQYESLMRLTATLCSVFPKIKCDYPRDASGSLRLDTLARPEFDAYQGLLGHYHVQTNKTDPGPAFQWDLLIDGARSKMAGK
ncbi:N-acetylmuramoyl-L-alanine amidase [Paludisphaera mucosa]|uniref:N-acetylmuramoyl-L-alanine amidase n=1 Tax=Paludisphaera mucosa TaxID=3030827 RepID=A0ABT6F7H7_9BACT|nr:peptidoglycan recognition family protein [Paludisphaera mucosa]MDG3003479.1 peptidoglycan recognition family protein [Paludisphaera mucosa]